MILKTLKEKVSTPLGVILVVFLAVLGLLILNNTLLDVPYFGQYFKMNPVKKGIVVSSPKANDKIASPLTIKGYINGGGWTAFEAQAGIVNLVGEKGEILGTAILTVTDENWMKEFNNFQTDLEFNSEREQNGKLVFHNENASGDPERDKEYVLSVKIAKSQIETMTVKVYFGNNEVVARQDPGNECTKVLAVERIIPKTQAVARAALEELLKGPTNEEKEKGYFTSINSGVKIQSLVIENGVAKADFDEQLEFQVGGSCRVAAIRAQITQTLKQFPTVNSVIISIDNRTEDILQP